MKEWLSMEGYGFYVWGSYCVLALAIAIELWLLRRRRARAHAHVQQMIEEESI